MKTGWHEEILGTTKHPVQRAMARAGTTAMTQRATIGLLSLILSLILFGCSFFEEMGKGEIDLHGLTMAQYNYVRTESARGGKLDFDPQFHDHMFFLIDSIIYNKHEAALLTWGEAMKKLGVTNADHAVALYEEVCSATLTVPQQRAIRVGFKRERPVTASERVYSH